MRGLATVIKYNGWLLEPRQAEAWSKTMAGLWTERQRGSAERTELLSPSAALTQALFNASLHPNSDQHQPSYKPAYCVIYKIIRTNTGRTDSHSPGELPLISLQHVNTGNLCVWQGFQARAPPEPAKSPR